MSFRFTRSCYWPSLLAPIVTEVRYVESPRWIDPTFQDFPDSPSGALPDLSHVMDTSPAVESADADQAGGVSFTTLIEGVNPIIDEGVYAFTSGRISEARRAFAKAVAQDAGDPYAHVLYAWTWFAEGDAYLGAMSIRQALNDHPEILERPLDVRPLYPDRAVLDVHVDALARFLAQRPQDHDARFLLGYVLFAIEAPEAAWTTLEPLMPGAAGGDAVTALTRVLGSMLGRTPPDASLGSDPAWVAPESAPEPEPPVDSRIPQSSDEIEGS